MGMEVPCASLSVSDSSPPRIHSVLARVSPVHFAAGVVARLSIVAFALSSVMVPGEWLPFMVELREPDGWGEAVGLRFAVIVGVLVVSSILMLVDPVGPTVRALAAVRGAVRRAGACWEGPERVEGPDDVFARLLDREAVYRLEDVEGFVAYKTRRDWPMRWRRLGAWCWMARLAVDDALREGRPVVELGGLVLPTEETSYRLERVLERLRRPCDSTFQRRVGGRTRAASRGGSWRRPTAPSTSWGCGATCTTGYRR